MINRFYGDEQKYNNCNGIIHTIEELDEKYEMESTPCNTHGNGPHISNIKQRVKVSSPKLMEAGRSTSSCPTDHQSPIPSQTTPMHQLKHGLNYTQVKTDKSHLLESEQM